MPSIVGKVSCLVPSCRIVSFLENSITTQFRCPLDNSKLSIQGRCVRSTRVLSCCEKDAPAQSTPGGHYEERSTFAFLLHTHRQVRVSNENIKSRHISFKCTQERVCWRMTSVCSRSVRQVDMIRSLRFLGRQMAELCLSRSAR